MAYTPTVWQIGDVVTAEKLNKLENGVEGASASSLPTVTSDDNGDVLTVVEGTWAKAAPNGTDGLYIVRFWYGDVGIECDRTFAEIKAVLEGENLPIIIATYVGTIFSTLTTRGDETGITSISFHSWCLPVSGVPNFALDVLTMDANEITESYTPYELTPASNG